MAQSASSGKRTYKIGDVCKRADVQPYVLRYWETEFPALAPAKSGGGQRQYTEEEIEIILRIKDLLYSEGFTIAGAKKKLEAELSGDGAEPEAKRAEPVTETVYVETINEDARKVVREARRELQKLLEMLSD